jgi:Arc/MetJ-type ribon-helix-helix transcriptional regulator
MPNPRFQTRLPEDDAERVNEYVEEHGVSQSEAVRRLIRAGLEAEEEETNDAATTPFAGKGYASARVNEAARVSGGAAILLMLLFLVLVEVGAL